MTEDPDPSYVSLRTLTPSLYSSVTQIEQRYAERYFDKFVQAGGGWYRGVGEVRDERGLAQLAYKYSTYAVARFSIPIAISAGVLIGLGGPNAWVWGSGLVLLGIGILYMLAIGRRFRAVRAYFERGDD